MSIKIIKMFKKSCTSIYYYTSLNLNNKSKSKKPRLKPQFKHIDIIMNY